jgi:hypothetical protein
MWPGGFHAKVGWTMNNTARTKTGKQKSCNLGRTSPTVPQKFESEGQWLRKVVTRSELHSLLKALAVAND